MTAFNIGSKEYDMRKQSTTQGKDLIYADPKTMGVCPDKLEKIGQMVKETYLDTGLLPGAHVLIARGGKVVYDQVQGYANIKKKQKLKYDSIYRIFSMTKPVTAVALMQLYEKGFFTLDDPVSDYLPEFEHQSVWTHGQYPYMFSKPVKQPITIRNLLTHTSGLSYEIQRLSYVDQAYRRISGVDIDLAEESHEHIKPFKLGNLKLEDYVKAIAQVPLQYDPGQRWLYSNAIDICGRLIEVMSKESLSSYFQSYVLEPLGMLDTGFYVPRSEQHRLTELYYKTKEHSLFAVDEDISQSQWSCKPVYESGGGGLVSTMNDYYRFADMQLNQGSRQGETVLSKSSHQLMIQNHLPNGSNILDMGYAGSFTEQEYQTMGYGLGFGCAFNHDGQVARFGWGGAASTDYWVDPDEELVCLLMTQLLPSTSYPIRKQLVNMTYGSLLD